MPTCLRSLTALVAASLLCAPLPARGAAASARIVGTLLLRDRDRSLTPAEAQRLVRGRPIGLALRRGWEVAPARLEGNGRFAVDVSPGTWRLEWIEVGDRAEILATPLEIDAREGAPNCAGRIEVAFSDLESELGASAAGTVRVVDGCDAPAGAAATSRGAPDGYVPPFGFPEVAEGLRVEGFFADQQPGLRLSMAFPLRRPLAWMGNVVVVGGGSRLFSSDGTRDALEVGGGFVPWWGAELTGGARWERGLGGVAPWAAVRLGPAPYAFIVRVDLRDGATWSLGLDLSAFHVVGRLL